MVELALWTHNIVSDLQPELLGKAPNLTAPTNGGSPLPSDESNLEPPSTNGNGKISIRCPFAKLPIVTEIEIISHKSHVRVNGSQLVLLTSPLHILSTN